MGITEKGSYCKTANFISRKTLRKERLPTRLGLLSDARHSCNWSVFTIRQRKAPLRYVLNRLLEDRRIMPRKPQHDVARSASKPANHSSLTTMINVFVPAFAELAAAALASPRCSIDKKGVLLACQPIPAAYGGVMDACLAMAASPL
jgi:hypothetical protein